MNAREVARRVMARVATGGAYATLALDGELGRAGLDEWVGWCRAAAAARAGRVR